MTYIMIDIYSLAYRYIKYIKILIIENSDDFNKIMEGYKVLVIEIYLLTCIYFLI